MENFEIYLLNYYYLNSIQSSNYCIPIFNAYLISKFDFLVLFSQ